MECPRRRGVGSTNVRIQVERVNKKASPHELNAAEYFATFPLPMTDFAELQRLQDTIVRCRLCPRLVRWREEVAREKVARFADHDYWGKPVPSFGDPKARFVIIGLAPAAHGANRTGRMFTGDRSGEWLYRALHKAGFANQAGSSSAEDGLRLKNCYITAAARCAPPLNKLTAAELAACRPFLHAEIEGLSRARVFLALGKIATDAAFEAFRDLGLTTLARRPKFGHGASVRLNDHRTLLMSYHPSQQNTFTGKLTEPMFDAVFTAAKRLL
jgi:uracil-DNA glycosylase family 4